MGVSPIVAVLVIAAISIAGFSLYYTGNIGRGSFTPSGGYGMPHAPATTTTVARSSNGSATSASGTPAKVSVSIVSGAHLFSQTTHFVPQTITVVIGVNNTVSWTNNDGVQHTVTSDGGVFDSGALNPGSVFTFTFKTPGTFSYHCDIHPFMTGKVIVLAAP